MQQPTSDQSEKSTHTEAAQGQLSHRSSGSLTPFDQPTAVHFGAGSIGLGFIGVLLAKAGYYVIFADINSKVINRLNDDTSYTINYLEPRRPKPFHVHNVSGVLSSDKEGIMELAMDIADKEMKLITTSIGFGALDKVAPIIARGITSRKQGDGGSLNVIACENGKGATDVLKDAVYHNLDKETQVWADDYVGFANCSVDRIVPQPLQEQKKLLNIGVDKFFEWVVDIKSLKSVNHDGPEPSLNPPIPGMILTENLPAFQARKLYTFNCGHATTAYLGILYGHKVISEAINDRSNVFPTVQGAMRESGHALVKEYPDIFDEDGMEEHIQKTIGRFKNPEVVDDLTRVGRSPLRKLGVEERLLGPFHLAKKHGLRTEHLAVGIAAALMYRNDEDDQAVELKDTEEKFGIEETVVKILSLPKGGDHYNEVMHAYGTLKGKTTRPQEMN
ncbi:hypothetical protein Agabi119p4_6407 [Agaricus bisporus var. burnettii]|uniref:Mannitol-1-phosphate 5-dehydrogenase n=1 Tax=Agaricus bisporus var. burnettii TaxID=192524 RepID=A0A8H7CA09_AGABI|nr:hypothetical protein Agabi119p4_6407 [Agaricus bisporus var. burnettii]